MVNTSTANESNHEALESYFKKYPDVPKETILKQHLLSLGHWFSDAALDATAGALVKSYRLFSYDLVPMSEFKRNEHRRVPEHFVLLNGPYGMRPVSIQTSLSPYSPYLIDVVDGRLVLTTAGRVLAEVRFPKTPDYYAKSLPDGTPYHEIVAFGSFITIFRNCQYWGAKEECKFCDINENARQMKLSRDFTLTAPVKPVADVVRVCEEVASDARQHGARRPGFVLSGGTITKTLHGKSEADFYEPYIRAIKGCTSDPRITFEVNARPREEVERYKAAGVDNIHFNMEVWDRRLFEWINPGKAERIGWDNWVALDVRRGGDFWHRRAAELRLRGRDGASARVSIGRRSGQIVQCRLRIPDVARDSTAATTVAARAIDGAVQRSRAAAGAVGFLYTVHARLVRALPKVSRKAAAVWRTGPGSPSGAQFARPGSRRLWRLCFAERKFASGRHRRADQSAQRAV